MQNSKQPFEGKTVVLLDLDGTLVNSVEAHAKSWQDTLKEHGHEASVYDLQRMVGMGGDKIIRKVIGSIEDDAIEKMESFRSKLFREKYLTEVYPFPNSHRLINRLREIGILPFLATASPSEDRDDLLRRGGLEDQFHDFVNTDEVEASKPEPDLIRAILAHLDIEPSHAVLIGDSPFDGEAAYRAGVDFVGVETGCYTRDELLQAVAVYPDVASIAEEI